MSGYRLEVKLKQHTPLIHFQHDQNGAALRASEVKPKLDRFIIERLTTEEKKEWLTEKKTLPFKLKIESTEEKYYDDRELPMFFGNMSKDENSVKKRGITHSNVYFTVYTPDEALRAKIKESLALFFFTHNFGARQSKGYGSFYIDKFDINGIYKEPDDLWKKNTLYVSKFSSKDILKDIDLFYKTIRSGINQCHKICTATDSEMDRKCQVFNKCGVRIVKKNGCVKYRCEHLVFGNKSIFYCKSALFKFLDSKTPNRQWDKKTIKEAYFTKYSPKIDNSQLLYRDLLGLASETIAGGATLSKENIDSDIERYKSPILIKPITTEKGSYIYIGYVSIDSQMLNKEFSIKKDKIGSLKMFTPTIFELKDYFDFLFKKSNHTPFLIESLMSSREIENTTTKVKVTPNHTKHEFYQKLIAIYNELQNNYKQ
jgi:hypothetical protein